MTLINITHTNKAWE